MSTRLTRPTLAELWRVLHVLLEGLGVEDAPDLARTLAVAGLTGRPAETPGVRVARCGEEVLIVTADRASVSDTSPAARPRRPLRSRSPLAPTRSLP